MEQAHHFPSRSIEKQPMLCEQSILCFAPEPWDGVWRNRHQIMSRLAKTNRVLFIEPRIYSFSDLRRGRITWSDVRHPRLIEGMENLWLYRYPVYGLTSGRRVIDWLGHRLRILALRHAMRQLGMERPILWLCRPIHVDVVGHLDELLVCYHVVDEYTAYSFLSSHNRQQLLDAEPRMLNLADIVFVVSPALLESKSRYHSNVHMVRNAVDFDTFVQVANTHDPPPPDIATLPRPRIGYVGVVNAKLDYELLRHTAETLPNCSLVLVGPIHQESGVEQLRDAGLDNVTFLGRKDVSDVPHYINACDVCLLPYRQIEWTRNIDALKLYEYLACGKPIVAVDIPTVRPHSAVIRIADSREAFVSAVEAALAENSPEAIEQRYAVARENTWDQRVELISSLITRTLNERRSKRTNNDG